VQFDTVRQESANLKGAVTMAIRFPILFPYVTIFTVLAAGVSMTHLSHLDQDTKSWLVLAICIFVALLDLIIKSPWFEEIRKRKFLDWNYPEDHHTW
jgi:hypothetical protein